MTTKAMRLAWLASASFFIAPAALAQSGVVPDNAVAIGTGPGGVGFQSSAPGQAGGVLTSNGPSSKPTFQSTLRTNVQTADYTVALADCGGIVQVGTGTTGQKTLTLPSVASGPFPEGCRVGFRNGDTGRGKKLAGFPSGMTIQTMLYPQQAGEVQVIGGAWAVVTDPGRWPKFSSTFYIDNAGSDSNDGLDPATPLQTLNGCRQVAQTRIDTQSGGNGGVTCQPTAGQTYQEFVQVFFPLVGGGSIIFKGNGGAFTWKPANNSFALQFGDYGVVILQDVTLSTAGVTAPQGLAYGHQDGILDTFSGVSITPTVALPSGFACDQDTHFNIGPITINAGTLTNALYSACPGSTWNISGAETHVGTPNIGKWADVQANAKVGLGSVTFSGAVTATASTINGNGVLSNFSGSTLPGGFLVGNGGQYCTTQSSCVTAMGLGAAHGNYVVTQTVNFGAAGDTTYTLPPSVNNQWALGQINIDACSANITTATFEVRTTGGTLLTAAAVPGTNTSGTPGTAASRQAVNPTFTGFFDNTTNQLVFRIVNPASGNCKVALRVNQD